MRAHVLLMTALAAILALAAPAAAEPGVACDTTRFGGNWNDGDPWYRYEQQCVVKIRDDGDVCLFTNDYDYYEAGIHHEAERAAACV